MEVSIVMKHVDVGCGLRRATLDRLAATSGRVPCAKMAKMEWPKLRSAESDLSSSLGRPSSARIRCSDSGGFFGIQLDKPCQPRLGLTQALAELKAAQAACMEAAELFAEMVAQVQSQSGAGMLVAANLRTVASANRGLYNALAFAADTPLEASEPPVKIEEVMAPVEVLRTQQQAPECRLTSVTERPSATVPSTTWHVPFVPMTPFEVQLRGAQCAHKYYVNSMATCAFLHTLHLLTLSGPGLTFLVVHQNTRPSRAAVGAPLAVPALQSALPVLD